jgi:hypothetical protein
MCYFLFAENLCIAFNMHLSTLEIGLEWKQMSGYVLSYSCFNMVDLSTFVHFLPVSFSFHQVKVVHVQVRFKGGRFLENKWTGS